MEIVQEFEGQSIRVTPDGKFAASDVLKAIGQKNHKAAWTALKAQYPELVQETCTYSFGAGRPPEVLTEKGLLKLLMVAGGPKAATFREWAATQLQRLAGNDITLAAEIADKASTQDQAWLKERVESSLGAKTLSASIAEAGCSQRTYSKAHDMNNVAITGMTAREIQKYRQGRVTRDLYETSELALLNAAQTLEVATIKARGAKGDGHVLSIVSSISNDIADLRRKWLGERTYPVDGLLTVGV